LSESLSSERKRSFSTLDEEDEYTSDASSIRRSPSSLRKLNARRKGKERLMSILHQKHKQAKEKKHNITYSSSSLLTDKGKNKITEEEEKEEEEDNEIDVSTSTEQDCVSISTDLAYNQNKRQESNIEEIDKGIVIEKTDGGSSRELSPFTDTSLTNLEYNEIHQKKKHDNKENVHLLCNLTDGQDQQTPLETPPIIPREMIFVDEKGNIYNEQNYKYLSNYTKAIIADELSKRYCRIPLTEILVSNMPEYRQYFDENGQLKPNNFIYVENDEEDKEEDDEMKGKNNNDDDDKVKDKDKDNNEKVKETKDPKPEKEKILDHSGARFKERSKERPLSHLSMVSTISSDDSDDDDDDNNNNNDNDNDNDSKNNNNNELSTNEKNSGNSFFSTSAITTTATATTPTIITTTETTNVHHNPLSTIDTNTTIEFRTEPLSAEKEMIFESTMSPKGKQEWQDITETSLHSNDDDFNDFIEEDKDWITENPSMEDDLKMKERKEGEENQQWKKKKDNAKEENEDEEDTNFVEKIDDKITIIYRTNESKYQLVIPIKLNIYNNKKDTLL